MDYNKSMPNLFQQLFARKSVGLALGGGVVRGLAHIGVLKVLHKHQIPIDLIAATSSGSIVGALFAAGIDPDEMERIALRTGWGRIMQWSFSTKGTFSGEGVSRFIEQQLGTISFKDLQIPLEIVSTNLKNGRKVVLREGSVADAVRASCAFPGLFTPVVKGNMLLVDGSIAENVPVETVKAMGARKVIAVDVVPGTEFDADLTNALHMVGRSIDLMINKLSQSSVNKADFTIAPKIDADIWHLDFQKTDRLIKAGEAAARKIINELERLK
jgi:NTE family protein